MDTTSIPCPEDKAEEWRPILGYEGSYEVSHLGRVRSLDRYVPFRRYGTIVFCFAKGRILSQDAVGETRQYLTVQLHKDTQHVRKYVHHLVLEAFLGKSSGLEANHIDGNPKNNAIGNLEWVTSSRNKEHTYEIGRRPRGERHHLSRYTPEQVLRIRRLSKEGMSNAAICRLVGISDGGVRAILGRKTWKHLPE